MPAEVTVKICGLKDAATAEAIAGLPIDQIGFMFAESKRKVNPRDAADMIRRFRIAAEGARTTLAVGVFVDPTEEELAAVLAEAPLDVIQLHGDESPAFCAGVRDRFQTKVYKAVSVGGRSPMTVDRLREFEGAVDAVLLDTFDPSASGGTGKTFAWDCLPEYLEWSRSTGIPLIVAGGLHPDNVADLVRTYRPGGVDVSSGVETDGVKDVLKIRSFVERVKSDEFQP